MDEGRHEYEEFPSQEFITVLELAKFRGAEDPRTGEDFAKVGLAIMGGCEVCGATIACYNAYPSKSGFWRCGDCLGSGGYETAEEANDAIFDGEMPHV